MPLRRFRDVGLWRTGERVRETDLEILSMRALTRREFIALGATALVVAAGGGVMRVRLQPAPTPNAPSLPSPTPGSSAFKYPATSLPLPLWITAPEDLYTVQYDQPPSVSLTSWSLTIHGMVRNSLRLTFDELRALPAESRMHTLECIGNPAGGSLIGNLEWRGAALRDLLIRAGVEPQAKYATLGGVDEYFTSVPVERVMHERALLAYEMNGQPLPTQHGFPVRILLPGVYGQKQPKWLTGIKLTDTEDLGPWEKKGWSREATIQLNSGIKFPTEANPVPRGDVLIVGVAHAGEAGVRAVELSTDGGTTWHDTVLTRGPSPEVWTQWGYRFENPAPGRYTLLVRAIDRQGNSQAHLAGGILGEVFPHGTSAIHSVVIQVRET